MQPAHKQTIQALFIICIVIPVFCWVVEQGANLIFNQ